MKRVQIHLLASLFGLGLILTPANTRTAKVNSFPRTWASMATPQRLAMNLEGTRKAGGDWLGPQLSTELSDGACCSKKPAFTDPNYGGFTGTVAVVTCFADRSGDPVIGVVDLKDQASAPINMNWNPRMYHNPSWTKRNLGNIFGLTLDAQGNIYVAATSAYLNDSFGPDGPGAVYKIDGVTGLVSTFAKLPNTGPGLGNISYDCMNSQFFVTNHEDGLIYKLDSNGRTLSTFDHGVNPNNPTRIPDNGSPGFTQLGRRLWGVQVRGDRVFYGVWREDQGRPDAAQANEIWSVALAPSGDFLPSSARLELKMPIFDGAYSNPVSDISFSPAGRMLLAERSMSNNTDPSAHHSRAMEFQLMGETWVPSGATFKVGVGALDSPPQPSSAGGADYDNAKDGRVWVTGDSLHLSNNDYIYGLQGLPATGGDIRNSILIDLNGDVTEQNKTVIGDVRIACPPLGSIRGAKWNDRNRNGGKDPEESGLPGWTIDLSGAGVNLRATTDEQGNYSFANLLPGTYTLSEVLQTGWMPTAPVRGSQTVELAAGATLANVNFGNTDIAPPTIICPANMTVECTGAAGTLVTFRVTATDNSDANPTVTCVPPSGNTLPLGATTVTCTATDVSGNTARCSFTVSVVDRTPPVITCPGNLEREAGPNCAATANVGIAVATDTCSGPLMVTGTRSDGKPVNDPYPLGVTTIVWKAADGAGNMSTCPQTVTVVDQTPPTVRCPANMTVLVGTNCQAAIPNLIPSLTAFDNCTPAASLTITQSPAAGTMAGLGAQTVSVTVTDAAGNRGTCTTTVTVVDQTPPTEACPVARTVPVGANCQAAIPNLIPNVTASDNCTPANSLTITQSPAAGTMVGLGAQTVTVTVADAAGNRNTCTTTVTVVDQTAPTITCPENKTAPAGANCTASVSVGTATATDNCPGSVTVTGTRSDAKPLSDPYTLGLTIITWRAVDAAGNAAGCAQTVTVVDQTPPTVECPGPATVSAGANCQAAIPSVIPRVTAADNCTPVASLTITQSPAAGTMVGLGAQTVTVTVTDAAGNRGACTTTVTVTNTPPIADAGPDQTLEPGGVVTLNGSGSSDPDPGQPLTFLWTQTAGPAVTLSSATAVMPAFTAPPTDAVLSFQLKVTDPCGVMATATVQVTTITPACALPPNNMVLWLPFDEAAGPTAVNIGGGPNGVRIGSPSVVNEYVAKGLCFNGMNQYVEVPSYAAINFGTGDFSLDAWVKRSPNDDGVRMIIDKRVESLVTQGYSFFLGASGTLDFQLADGAGATSYTSQAAVPNDGRWHHVAVSIQRSDMEGGKFYLDGAQVGPAFNTALNNGSVSSNSPFRVGSRSSSVSGSFLGCIDEVEAFNRVLSPDEVASIYNAKSSGKCKSAPDLPDFAIPERPLVFPVPLVEGTFIVSFAIANQGMAPVNARVNHDIRLVTVGGNPDGVSVGTVTTGAPLAAGASQRFPLVTFRIPPGPGTRTFFIRVIADSESRVQESNERNNTGESLPFQFP